MSRAIQPFGTLPTIDGGADVICTDTGRTVSHRPTLRSANGLAQALNSRMRTTGNDYERVLAGGTHSSHIHQRQRAI